MAKRSRTSTLAQFLAWPSSRPMAAFSIESRHERQADPGLFGCHKLLFAYPHSTPASASVGLAAAVRFTSRKVRCRIELSATLGPPENAALVEMRRRSVR